MPKSLGSQKIGGTDFKRAWYSWNMKLSGLRIAITGGAGFIGSHLVDQLVQYKNKIIVFDNFSTGSRENIAVHRSNPEVSIVDGDVRDLLSLERALESVDVLFHLATNCVRLSLSDPQTNHDVNATGTLNSLLAAKKKGVKRYVYCSSSEVYGDIQNSLTKSDHDKLTENSAKLPTTIYGASKLVGEYYALSFHKTYGLPAMVVRPFNAYGPRSYFSGPYGEVIPRFTMMVRAGRQPIIFGDGLQTRDFTYVEDTAAGLIASAECDQLLGDNVNLAHGEEVSIVGLTHLLCELHNVPYNPKHTSERPGEIRRLGADVSKAKKILSLESKTSIKDGLTRYLKWLDQQNLDYQSIAKNLSEKNWTDPAKR